jgi:hypothetical protein
VSVEPAGHFDTCGTAAEASTMTPWPSGGSQAAVTETRWLRGCGPRESGRVRSAPEDFAPNDVGNGRGGAQRTKDRLDVESPEGVERVQRQACQQ